MAIFGYTHHAGKDTLPVFEISIWMIERRHKIDSWPPKEAHHRSESRRFVEIVIFRKVKILCLGRAICKYLQLSAICGVIPYCRSILPRIVHALDVRKNIVEKARVFRWAPIKYHHEFYAQPSQRTGQRRRRRLHHLKLVGVMRRRFGQYRTDPMRDRYLIFHLTPFSRGLQLSSHDGNRTEAP